MSSCLGLYIENNIIKYAKVTKDHDNIKVDSFGIKFYDNVDESIKQIISETYSYKTPISVNLSDEKYTYSDLFSLLNKADLEKAVKTEFDYFCNENNKNRNALEYRYLLSPNLDDKDKITTLYAYSDKSNIVRKLQILDGYKVTSISPLPMTIQNLSSDNEKTSAAIINIEKNTSVTFIVNGQIQRVETIEIGMRDVFENIIQKENSYAKAYEICKNTTIYTMQGRNLQVEENEYMEDIMPVLYNIVERTKDIIRSSGLNIEDIYISGLATSINNIDLYFQENFPDKKCEILVPYFVQKTNIKLNIKDYIEVNSAIALALQGLGIGNKAINFKNKSLSEQISQALNIEFGKNPKEPKEKKEPKESNKSTQKLKSMFKLDFGQSLDNIEKGMLRAAVGILILIIIYAISTSIIMNQIKNKDNEVLAYIGDTEKEISKITNNTSLISSRKEQYKELVDKINQENDKLTQSYARKNALPNFLTQVMYNIPKEVQLISIRNSADKGITIQAQSKVYEQLGYFIAKIKNEGILTGVTATSGQQQGEFIVITIEGNLPY
ncbi:MAG: hypothetical protein IJE59_04035 [Clostridia bacterium]|nr:hypothetical protein [Clostridia bacterium]